MRNVLAHDYRGVDYNIVWDVTQTKLQSLKITLSEIIIKYFAKSDLLIKNLDSKYYKHIQYLKTENNK